VAGLCHHELPLSAASDVPQGSRGAPGAASGGPHLLWPGPPSQAPVQFCSSCIVLIIVWFAIDVMPVMTVFDYSCKRFFSKNQSTQTMDVQERTGRVFY